eukprot:TRINITY_DN1086_c0_g1_i5.p1 TRINITY_DN1086_c0_g1~~TRINITY_DN1086_c0_g1_i5.p1  ORF type:complete len:190 (-),score=12.25 TRINITY_DN1086_c0_g1_i5:1675-2244(-)
MNKKKEKKTPFILGSEIEHLARAAKQRSRNPNNIVLQINEDKQIQPVTQPLCTHEKGNGATISAVDQMVPLFFTFLRLYPQKKKKKKNPFFFFPLLTCTSSTPSSSLSFPLHVVTMASRCVGYVTIRNKRKRKKKNERKKEIEKESNQIPIEEKMTSLHATAEDTSGREHGKVKRVVEKQLLKERRREQ